MNKAILLDRIVIDPNILVGKPVIKGTRLSVEHILNLLAHGMTEQQIMEEYPGLTVTDIRACLLFGANSVGDATFVPLVESI